MHKPERVGLRAQVLAEVEGLLGRAPSYHVLLPIITYPANTTNQLKGPELGPRKQVMAQAWGSLLEAEKFWVRA